MVTSGNFRIQGKRVERFEKHEKRDTMYKVAIFLVSHF